MENVVKIALQVGANLSIREALAIASYLGSAVNDEEAVKATVLQYKFSIYKSWIHK